MRKCHKSHNDVVLGNVEVCVVPRTIKRGGGPLSRKIWGCFFSLKMCKRVVVYDERLGLYLETVHIYRAVLFWLRRTVYETICFFGAMPFDSGLWR